MRLLILALCLVLAGCGTVSEEAIVDPAGHPGIVIDPAKALNTGDVAAANAAFGVALLDKLGEGNVICSPYSIATALQMALLGARGETAAEMLDVLHLADLSPSELASTAAVLRKALQPLSRKLSVSNALWPARSLPLEPGYVRAVEEGFGPKTQRLDYVRDAEGARRTINAAIAEATHDKIPELLREGTVDASTIMVLTNAVYLKAQWALPFDQNGTRDGTFTRPDGTTVTAKMMTQNEFSYGYRDADGYQVIRLPYKGDKLAMTILLPDDDLAAVEEILATQGLAKAIAGTTPTRMRLAMPRFKFRTQADLTQALQNMGVRAAFMDADLTGMTPRAARIDSVVHEAMIDVDEKGTEAAAATAVIIDISKPPPPELDIRIDRPFLFVITDTETGSPLFLGRVTDPTQG